MTPITYATIRVAMAKQAYDLACRSRKSKCRGTSIILSDASLASNVWCKGGPR